MAQKKRSGTSSAKRKSSTSSKRSTAKRASSHSKAKKPAEPLTWLPLFGIGLVLIALAFLKGASFWTMAHNGLFGLLGISAWLIGPAFLWFGVRANKSEPVSDAVFRSVLGMIVLSGTTTAFSKLQLAGLTVPQALSTLFTTGTASHFSGGVLGFVLGGSLLMACGRPAVNILMIIGILCALMVGMGIGPAQLVAFAALIADGIGEKSRAAAQGAAEHYESSRARREERAEERRASRQMAEQEAEDEEAYDEYDDAEIEEDAEKPGLFAGIKRFFGNLFARGEDDGEYDTDYETDGTDAGEETDPDRVASHRSSVMETARENGNTENGTDTPAAPLPASAEQTIAAIRQAQAASAATSAATAAAAAAASASASAAVSAAAETAGTAEQAVPFDVGEGGTFGLKAVREAIDNPTRTPYPGRADATTYRHTAPAEPVTQTSDAQNVSAENSAETPAAAAPVNSGSTYIRPAQPPVQQPAAVRADDPVAIFPEGGLYPAAPQTPQSAADAQPGDEPAAIFPQGGETAAASDAAAAAEMEAEMNRTSIVESIPAASVKPQSANAAKPQQGTMQAKPAAAPAAAKPAASAAHFEPVRDYCFPPIELFDTSVPETDDARIEQERNAQKLVETLESFGVRTELAGILRGPSVTRYELKPLAGVKISKITNLADDIALNLAVADVRIEAPVPGKPVVGIEVPNRKASSVTIRGLFESDAFKYSKGAITVALGRDIAGEPQVADLAKMPHVLIAGTTGSGKSVCVNSIIISILFSRTPEDVRLMLIDPKVVELAEYNGIPHLLMPVITEPQKAAGALQSMVGEMERRYHEFAEKGVRDIKSYNSRLMEEWRLEAGENADPADAPEKMPYIAIVIDELADLMMVAGKEVEESICRIAQKARAAGMHLIVATQRPSVDVVTGLIKANVPSRIAFAVSGQMDSRVILDTVGAEKLLGHGDMLFLPIGAAKPLRVQGTFVTDEEISRVLEFVKQTSEANYDEAMIQAADEAAKALANGGRGAKEEPEDDFSGDEHDPMFAKCVECVIDAGQASTSLLQRRCKLGYARAARIMDEMEQVGVIGAYEGAKPRSVLITRQQWLEMNLNETV